MGLSIVQLEVGLVQNFCEIIGCEETGEAALVDPAFEVDRLLAEVAKRGWKVTTLLLTHGHLDHINGLGEAAAATGAVVRCHELEVAAAAEYVDRERIVPLRDRERIVVGRGEIEALFTPGHTPSCVCFYAHEESAVFTGDVVFVGKVGSASDPDAMRHSLHYVIAALPEETRIYPGHDYGESPTSLLGWELGHNPGFQ